MSELHYKINKGFIMENIGDTITIFDPDHSQLYTLNEVASGIFTLIKKNKNIPEIIDYIVETYKISEKTAKKDVFSLIKQLQEQKILREETA